jgi:AmiR/NasT family two-component response regulator
MSEADAFSWIQRRAMSDRTRKRTVAERIVAGELSP